MNNAFIISQVLGFVILVISVIGIQFKKMEYIAITGFVSNGLNAIAYILLNGISGSYVSIVAAIQAVFAFVYAKKNLSMPKWIIFSFMAVYILLSIYTYKNIVDILPGLGALMYSLAIVQEKSANYRKYMLINVLVWIIYNIIISAYVAIISQVISLISIIISVFRNDIKKSNKAD